MVSIWLQSLSSRRAPQKEHYLQWFWSSCWYILMARITRTKKRVHIIPIELWNIIMLQASWDDYIWLLCPFIPNGSAPTDLKQQKKTGNLYYSYVRTSRCGICKNQHNNMNPPALHTKLLMPSFINDDNSSLQRPSFPMMGTTLRHWRIQNVVVWTKNYVLRSSHRDEGVWAVATKFFKDNSIILVASEAFKDPYNGQLW